MNIELLEKQNVNTLTRFTQENRIFEKEFPSNKEQFLLRIIAPKQTLSSSAILLLEKEYPQTIQLDISQEEIYKYLCYYFSTFQDKLSSKTILQEKHKNIDKFVDFLNDTFRGLVVPKLPHYDKLLFEFISDNHLQGSLVQINKLINEVFGHIKRNIKLYTDPEEPEYRYVQISIVPGENDLLDIEALLNKYDELQDKFVNEIPVEYSSKIVFHLNTTHD